MVAFKVIKKQQHLTSILLCKKIIKTDEQEKLIYIIIMGRFELSTDGENRYTRQKIFEKKKPLDLLLCCFKACYW